MAISTTMVLSMTVQTIGVITLVTMIAQILGVTLVNLRENALDVLIFAFEFERIKQLLKSGFSLHRF